VNLRVQLLGFPASITVGGPLVGFNVILTNDGSTPLSDVAPLFQLVGGACNCVQGSLEQLDSPVSTWHPAPMPEGNDPNFLAKATGGFTIAPGKSINFNYLLRLSPGNPAKPVTAIFYAVQLPGDTELASASVPSQLIAS
jgi:hypothetical protein